MTISTKEVPAVRRDGRCCVCGKKRVIPKTRQKGVPVETYERDPFCSNDCARKYFNNPIRSKFTDTSS